MKLMAKVSLVKFSEVKVADELCVPVGIGSIESAEELGKSLLTLRDQLQSLAHDRVIRMVVRFEEVDETGELDEPDERPVEDDVTANQNRR